MQLTVAQGQSRPDAGSILKNLENNKFTVPKQNLPEFEEKQKEIIIPKVQPVETFVIKKITFEGNTLVSNDELNFIFKDLINRKIALDELKSAIDEIAILYDKKGFLGFGSLPSQEIEQENLKILIIEGLFGGVKFDENNLNDLNVDPVIIKKIIENINPIGKPLNVKKLDESILISGDLSGILVNFINLFISLDWNKNFNSTGNAVFSNRSLKKSIISCSVSFWLAIIFLFIFIYYMI